jgi:hypothetical protein
MRHEKSAPVSGRFLFARCIARHVGITFLALWCLVQNHLLAFWGKKDHTLSFGELPGSAGTGPYFPPMAWKP